MSNKKLQELAIQMATGYKLIKKYSNSKILVKRFQAKIAEIEAEIEVLQNLRKILPLILN